MRSGGVPERSNGAVLKTVGRASASWVRIPPPPCSARMLWRSPAGKAKPHDEHVPPSVRVADDEVVGERCERDDAAIGADPRDHARRVRLLAVSRDAHARRRSGEKVVDEYVGYTVPV